MVLVPIILVIAGLLLLVKGADHLIEGAADIARWMKVSPILVGLTIVAFGTSLPEFIISVFAAITNNTDISIGTIVGSNIANITLGIGIAALFMGLVIKSKTLMYEFPFVLVSTFLLLVLANDFFIFQRETFILDRFDALVLLAVFGIFIYYIFRSMKEDVQSVEREYSAEFKHKNPPWKNALFILGGLVALLAGGHLFVNGAVRLAVLAGVSEVFIGLTVAALGTSLPELTASIRAAWKGHADIALGNIVGSYVFNILFALGIPALIRPIAINPGVLAIDGIVLTIITLFFLLFAASGKRISRGEGVALVAMYLAYLAFLIVRL